MVLLIAILFALVTFGVLYAGFRVWNFGVINRIKTYEHAGLFLVFFGVFIIVFLAVI